MRKLFCVFAAMLLLPAVAEAELVIGTDLADARSDAPLVLTPGQAYQLEIWAGGEVGQNIRGLSFNLIADAPGVVNSTSLVFDEQGDRWPVTNAAFVDWTGQSSAGTLVNDAQVATLGTFGGTGISFTADNPFVRLATLGVTMDQFGTTNVEFSVGTNPVNDATGEISGFSVGSRTITAIPEPSTAALLGLMGVAGIGLRRRSRR